VNWLNQTKIPRSWRLNSLDEMIPPANHTIGDPVHMLMHSTLSKYVGRIIGFFKRKFSTHPDFIDLNPRNENAVPAWWTNMRSKFERDVSRAQKKKSSECAYGGPKIRPLYYKSSNASITASDTETVCDYVSRIDICSILKTLMLEATITHAKEGPMQKRAQLAVT
jgi:hypothetical protein